MGPRVVQRELVVHLRSKIIRHVERVLPRQQRPFSRSHAVQGRERGEVALREDVPLVRRRPRPCSQEAVDRPLLVRRERRSVNPGEVAMRFLLLDLPAFSERLQHPLVVSLEDSIPRDVRSSPSV